MIVPETPENAKLKVGRDPDTAGLRPVMSRSAPSVTGTSLQPDTAAPVASRTVSFTVEALPPPAIDTRRNVVHSEMPALVEHA